MPVYDFSPSEISVSFDILPKGEYEFEIGTPKPFLRQAGEDKHDSYGVRFPLKVVNPVSMASLKVQPYSIYMQSEGGQGFAKQFIMAAMGYGKGSSEEKRFNTDMAGKDWKFNPEDGYVGDAYSQCAGQTVIGIMDKQPNPNNAEEEQQKFNGWRSLASGPIEG